MTLFSERPVLHEKATQQALDALRSGHGLRAHPLQICLTVLARLESPYALRGDAAVQVAVFDYLKTVISERLTDLRQPYNLSPAGSACLDDDLKCDFDHRNMELEAWSFLYYRYVCVDRDLSVQQIADLTDRDKRTLRRRQKLGISRLTHELVSREQKARQQETERRLRLALPAFHPPLLFGVESLVATAMHFLTDSAPPHHLVLHGPVGIGKTVLAQALAHQMVARDQLEDLLWFEVPESALTPTALVYGIAEGLGLPRDDSANLVWTLRAYLLTHPTLIVLDRADNLLDDEDAAAYLMTIMDSAAVILTSHMLPPSSFWCYLITLPGLNREQAFAFLEYVAEHEHQERRDDHWAERFNKIWEFCGGNPAMLKAALKISYTLPLESILTQSKIDRLYEHLWQQLPADCQGVCLIPLLFPAKGLVYEQINALSGQANEVVDQALLALVGRTFLTIQYDQDVRYYRLSPVLATFLLERLRHGLTLADGESVAVFLRRVLRRRVDQLVHSPDPKAAVALLPLADALDFPETEKWEHAYRLAPQITEAGLWLPWHRHLTTLLSEECSASQSAWLDLMLGITLRWLGQLGEALDHLGRSMTYYVGEGSPRQADAMGELAVIYRYRGEWQAANRLLENALDLYTRFDVSKGVERCLHELAQLALEHGDAAQALDWLDRLEQRSIRSWGIAGQAHSLLNQFEQAHEAADQLQFSLPIDSPNYGRAVATLGLIYDSLGEPDAAVEYLLLAAELLERAKDMVGYSRACNNLAVAYLKQPIRHRQVPIQEIHRLLMRALRIQEDIGDEIGLTVTEQNLRWFSSMDAGDDEESNH
jgi:tetratricopeptide (TPR) repeat protein